MNFKNKYIYFVTFILIIGFSIGNVQQARPIMQANYSPNVNDSFSYNGKTTSTQTQTNFRIVTNSSNGALIDYMDQYLAMVSITDLSNVNFTVNSINQSKVNATISMAGTQDVTGSHTTNATKAYDPSYHTWSNQTQTNNSTPMPFNSVSYTDFNFSSGYFPSSVYTGPDMFTFVGMPTIPLGSNGNPGSNTSQSCNQSDLVNYTVINGDIQLPDQNPFNSLSSFQMMAIFPSYSFNWTEFGLDNLAYVGNHVADNISWSAINVGYISGIGNSYNGTDVVLVYHLVTKQFGMLEASANYCPYSTGGGSGGSGGFDPLSYFVNLTSLSLNWNEINRQNRIFTINGNQYTLATKTEEGYNHTARQLTVNMSLGDPSSPFYALVNLTLQIYVLFDFEYDSATGFMVGFWAMMALQFGISAQNLQVPIPNTSTMGLISINVTTASNNTFNYNLQSHSSLYKTPQNTSQGSTDSTGTSGTTPSNTSQTTTAFTGSTNSTKSTTSKGNTTITADYPSALTILGFGIIGTLVTLRRRKT